MSSSHITRITFYLTVDTSTRRMQQCDACPVGWSADTFQLLHVNARRPASRFLSARRFFSSLATTQRGCSGVFLFVFHIFASTSSHTPRETISLGLSNICNGNVCNEKYKQTHGAGAIYKNPFNINELFVGRARAQTAVWFWIPLSVVAVVSPIAGKCFVVLRLSLHSLQSLSLALVCTPSSGDCAQPVNVFRGDFNFCTCRMSCKAITSEFQIESFQIRIEYMKNNKIGRRFVGSPVPFSMRLIILSCTKRKLFHVFCRHENPL